MDGLNSNNCDCDIVDSLCILILEFVFEGWIDLFDAECSNECCVMVTPPQKLLATPALIE